jgi:hypothetical protein
MPKYDVTTDEGDGTTPSTERITYPSETAATEDAQISLADMAREKLPDGSHVRFNVTVADEDGQDIYDASLRFDANNGAEIRQAEDEEAAAAEKAADDIAAAIRARGEDSKA